MILWADIQGKKGQKYLFLAAVFYSEPNFWEYSHSTLLEEVLCTSFQISVGIHLDHNRERTVQKRICDFFLLNLGSKKMLLKKQNHHQTLQFCTNMAGKEKQGFFTLPWQLFYPVHFLFCNPDESSCLLGSCRSFIFLQKMKAAVSLPARQKGLKTKSKKKRNPLSCYCTSVYDPFPLKDRDKESRYHWGKRERATAQ